MTVCCGSIEGIFWSTFFITVSNKSMNSSAFPFDGGRRVPLTVSFELQQCKLCRVAVIGDYGWADPVACSQVLQKFKCLHYCHVLD